MGSTIMTMLDKLQVRLTALCRWPIDWGVELKILKCKIMNMSPKPKA
jgi:hypothetical protein